MKNNNSALKITVSINNDKERKKLESYLNRTGFSFTVRGDGGKAIDKSAGEIEAEQEYFKVTRNARFRCFKTENEQIKAGTKTREQIIRQRLKDIASGKVQLVVNGVVENE